MGIAEWWHYRGAPRVARPDPEVLDLVEGTFGGVALGDAPEAIARKLGAPASYDEAKQGRWYYPQWGLSIETKDDAVDGIAVAIDRDASFGFRAVEDAVVPFAGKLLLEREPIDAADVKEADVRRLYGEATDDDRDEDDGELYLTFETGGKLRIFVFTKDGRLGHAEVGRP